MEKVGVSLRQGCGRGSSYGPDLPAAQTPARKRTYTKARSLNLCHHSSGKVWKWQEGRESGRGGERGREKRAEMKVWREVTHNERHRAHVRNGVERGDGHRMNWDEDKGWLVRQWCKFYLLGRILLRLPPSTASGGGLHSVANTSVHLICPKAHHRQNSDFVDVKKCNTKKEIRFHHCQA